jgi:hypothetical protein
VVELTDDDEMKSIFVELLHEIVGDPLAKALRSDFGRDRPQIAQHGRDFGLLLEERVEQRP